MIWRDDGYGLIDWKQRNQFGRPYAVEFGNPDFVKYAESFGIPGFRPASADELYPTLMQALELDGPAVIDVRSTTRERAAHRAAGRALGAVMARRIEPPARRRAHLARTACLAAIVAACGAPGASDPTSGSPIRARRSPQRLPRRLRRVRRRLQPHLRRRGRRLPQGRGPASRWTALRRRRARTTPGRSIRKPLSRICSGARRRHGLRRPLVLRPRLGRLDPAAIWRAGARRPVRARGVAPRHGLLVTLGQAGATFFADVWLFDPTTGAWRSCPATVRRPCRATAAAPASGRTAGSGSPTASPRRARGSSTPGPTTSMPRPGATRRPLRAPRGALSPHLLVERRRAARAVRGSDDRRRGPRRPVGPAAGRHGRRQHVDARSRSRCRRATRPRSRGMDRRPSSSGVATSTEAARRHRLVRDPGEGGFSGGATAPFVRLELDGPPRRSGGAGRRPRARPAAAVRRHRRRRPRRSLGAVLADAQSDDSRAARRNASAHPACRAEPSASRAGAAGCPDRRAVPAPPDRLGAPVVDQVGGDRDPDVVALLEGRDVDPVRSRSMPVGRAGSPGPR